jgi:sugar phosphate isomerase/epimerase
MTIRTQPERISVFSACLPGWEAGKVIDSAAALGICTVEWASGPGHAIEVPDRGRHIREMCERAGVTIAGISVQDPDVTLETPALAKRHVELATALGAPHVRLLAPAYRGGSLRAEQSRARLGLDELLELAAPAGVAVLVETSPGTLAPTPELAVALVEHHSPDLAGVLYDPGNMVIEGHLDPVLAIACLGAHLRHVHVKNIAWSHTKGSWRWRHATLSTGMLDWRPIVRALAVARYEGKFSIDHLGGEVTAAKLEAETALLRDLVADGFGADGAGSPTSSSEGDPRSKVNASAAASRR